MITAKTALERFKVLRYEMQDEKPQKNYLLKNFSVSMILECVFSE